MQLHKLACSYISLHVVPWGCMQSLSSSEQFTRISQCLLFLCIFCSVRNWISAVQLHVLDACFHFSFSFALKMLLSFTLQFFWFCLFCIYLKTFISTALYFTVIPSPSRFSTKYSLGLGQKSIKRKEKVKKILSVIL